MAKRLIRQIGPYQHLYLDTKTGIAWVKNGSTGLGHSCHANIDASGSVVGMKNLGYWRKKDRIVQSHGFKYNIDTFVIDDNLDDIAAANCECGGKHHVLGTVWQSKGRIL